MARRFTVGVISDTHGLLRPEAVAALADCRSIIHAGDLGGAGIFDELAKIAPTVAIRGNVDRGSWAEAFPETLALTIEGATIYVLHDRHALDFDPVKNGIGVVISGHSHQPLIETKSGVLYLNPGSAGRRRFTLPVTLARLEIGPSGIQAELVDLLGQPRADGRAASR